jgi:DNA modification methylase
MSFEILHGDCAVMMSLFLDDNSVDAIVCDPPYGLGFMGKEWDHGVPAAAMWREALRVLKPGGYLLAFAGTRTQHRMACNIEDAGFEIRDMIAWVYGSGFPKSHNGEWGGTALKPALEPITVARKPLIGTVEANWRQHGVGALNIDRCRVGDEVRFNAAAGNKAGDVYALGVADRPDAAGREAVGRWPANLIHDGSDEVIAAFPQAAGQLAKASTSDTPRAGQNTYGVMTRGSNGAAARIEADKSAARFFYCAKASKSDRNEGLDDFVPATTNDGRAVAADNAYQRGKTERANTHPTVKPTELMRYLCRLVTPPGGLVLDPFLGSGSTGKAAVLEGFRFVGCELSAEYVEIARARIAAAAGYGAFA